LFNVSFEIHRNQINPGDTNITDTNNTSSTNQDTGNDENNEVNLPLDISFPIEYLLLLLVLMSLVFIRKILSLFRWVGEKIIYAGVLVIGAFYNVQDRILDANDIYLNQSRVELLDYLEYIGQYGSHIRELKSLTRMGTGSLLWHLQVLEDFYFIQKYKINRNTIFVAADFVDSFDQEYKALEMNIQSKYSGILIEELVNLIDQPDISVSELEALTNVNNRTIRRFLGKLNDYEIVSYIQTSPIVIVIDDKTTIKKLNKGYEMRADYTFSRSGIDVQDV
jgi:predicted transcriptional regulator